MIHSAAMAPGGGTGRTLLPDNMVAGPASYGMTDTMVRMHCDAQFAGSYPFENDGFYRYGQ